MLFTTSGAPECFYTSELRVIVDVFLRELVDLDKELVSVCEAYVKFQFRLMRWSSYDIHIYVFFTLS